VHGPPGRGGPAYSCARRQLAHGGPRRAGRHRTSTSTAARPGRTRRHAHTRSRQLAPTAIARRQLAHAHGHRSAPGRGGHEHEHGPPERHRAEADQVDAAARHQLARAHSPGESGLGLWRPALLVSLVGASSNGSTLLTARTCG
jgi:hypothetical protein